jgi:hypothetical protein
MDGLGALIISPTRELAFQTFEVLKRIGNRHDFSAGLVIGGKVYNGCFIWDHTGLLLFSNLKEMSQEQLTHYMIISYPPIDYFLVIIIALSIVYLYTASVV